MLNQSYAHSQTTKQARIHEYLDRKVTFLFERLVVELLSAQPSDVIDWSMNWLNTKGRSIVVSRTVSVEDIVKQASPQEVDLKKKQNRPLDIPKPQSKPQRMQQPSSEEEDEDEEDVQELPTNLAYRAPPRTSVSAEVYGHYNRKEDFVARVIPKAQEQKQRIQQRLMQSFMFQALDDRERDIVVDAMEEKQFKTGDWVIKQGEDGDNLYVVDSGLLDCYKRFSKDAPETHLKTYQPGESFGELALLYNAPRAASIQAKVDSIAFALDRATFNNIVKDAAVKKRLKYEKVLKSIELLASMDPYETTQICDGVIEKKYQAGDYVIREGDQGDIFYMIEEGSLIATKTVEKDIEPVQVYQYEAGDYFGELALLKDIPRQANVIAISDVKLVYLNQAAFKRLLGPIEDILRRNVGKYEKFMEQ